MAPETRKEKHAPLWKFLPLELEEVKKKHFSQTPKT